MLVCIIKTNIHNVNLTIYYHTLMYIIFIRSCLRNRGDEDCRVSLFWYEKTLSHLLFLKTYDRRFGL